MNGCSNMACVCALLEGPAQVRKRQMSQKGTGSFKVASSGELERHLERGANARAAM